MRGSKKGLGRTSCPEPAIGSDLAKVDAYVNTAADYEDIPELTDDDRARGMLHENGVPVRRGRPPAARTKRPITIRLDPDVVAHFQAAGPGWQSRINATLRKAAKLPKEG